jgi:hypothetical protein
MKTSIHHLHAATLRPVPPPPPGALMLLALVAACLKGSGG